MEMSDAVTTSDQLEECYKRINELEIKNEKLFEEITKALIPNHMHIGTLQMEDTYWRMWARRALELQRAILPGTLGLVQALLFHVEHLEKRHTLLKDRLEEILNNA